MNLTSPNWATEHIEKIDNSGYTLITNAIDEDTFSLGEIIRGLLTSFFGQDMVGWGITLLLAMIFYNIWQDQKNMLIPAICLLMFGGLIFTMIPASIIATVKLLVLLGLAGVVVKLYLDR